MSQFLYRGEVTSVPRSRNLVSRLGHEVLESMPRTTRSTPSPLAEAVPTDGMAPVSASPLALPNPKPSRALAFFVDPQIPLEDIRCFTPGPLGAGMVLDVSRVFLETGSSCAVGSRYEIACAMDWVATKVPPRPGAETSPMVLEAAEEKQPPFGRVPRARGYAGTRLPCVKPHAFPPHLPPVGVLCNGLRRIRA